jgi:hypothetical protein
MANHASTRTTQLYDRRRDAMTLDESGEDWDLREEPTRLDRLWR